MSKRLVASTLHCSKCAAWRQLCAHDVICFNLILRHKYLAYTPGSPCFQGAEIMPPEGEAGADSIGSTIGISGWYGKRKIILNPGHKGGRIAKKL